jgi:hypothetical protein
MKFKSLHLCLLLLAALNSLTWAAPMEPAITYQGRLTDGDGLANGTYDLRFSLYTVETEGSPIEPILTTNDLAVTAGLFTVTLDFSKDDVCPFDGKAYWLEIAVRTSDSGGDFTPLSPRQPLTPAPYALYARDAASAASAKTVEAAPWSSVTDIPEGFRDCIDNDTTYSAGAGLTLSGTVFSLDTTSIDERYDGRYWRLNGNLDTTAGPNFLGTKNDQPLEFKVYNMRALRLEPKLNGAPNVIAGSPSNAVNADVVGATVGGGGVLSYNFPGDIYPNIVEADFGTVAGGRGNTIGPYARQSTIGGGIGNTLVQQADCATISGGYSNRVEQSGRYATVSGGSRNTIEFNAQYATISGGRENLIGANASDGTIAGGWGNLLQPDAAWATIGGGRYNWIQSDTFYCTIAGGYTNRIEPGTEHATVGGGYKNLILAGASRATIGGGWGNETEAGSSTIGGGFHNTIQNDSGAATISGGEANAIDRRVWAGTIAGGANNSIYTNAHYAAIGGGEYNSIGTNVNYATISGGQQNTILSNANHTTISGGMENMILNDASWTSVGGGYLNVVYNKARYAAIGGGSQNHILTNVDYATIAGGYSNLIDTNADLAAIPGGKNARAAHYGQFAYASGMFQTHGDAQSSLFVLRRTTSDATPRELLLDNISSRLTVPPGSAWVFDALIVGRTRTTYAGEFPEADSAGYQIRGLIENIDGDTFIHVGSPTILWESDPSWNAVAETDWTTQALTFRVTGTTGKSVRWVASVRTSEVAWPE